MKIIKCLAEQIEDELEDADKYIELAMKWKTEDQQAADLFSELSTEEMGHVDKLHRLVAEKITQFRTERGEPPADMMAVYNYVHEKHIKKATNIRVKQNMYKA